ncbi:hypothetical protein ACJX0J_027794, partial [Zea mays]
LLATLIFDTIDLFLSHAKEIWWLVLFADPLDSSQNTMFIVTDDLQKFGLALLLKIETSDVASTPPRGYASTPMLKNIFYETSKFVFVNEISFKTTGFPIFLDFSPSAI